MSRRLRRIGRVLVGLATALTALAGVSGLGVATTMAQSFPAPLGGEVPRAAARPLPPDKFTVAVVIGASGTVASDALVPYEVFAGSGRFAVYTVAGSRTPAVLSGGVHVVPDRTFAESLPRPDVVVVPAVAAPTGDREAPLRAWVTAQAERGSRILGVCAGAEVLAASGLLDGRRATSHWSRVDSLRRSYPQIGWVVGERYVEDGRLITTAGVTSGAAGALRVMERLAGAEEAGRVGDSLGYPGWTRGGGHIIPVHRWALTDLPFGLNAAFPWFRPTIGLAVSDGVGEIDLAAVAEVYGGGSFAARTITVGASPTILTRHGLRLIGTPVGGPMPRLDRLVAPGGTGSGSVDPALTSWAAERGLAVERLGGDRTGEFGFDPVLRDLARRTDRATARATAAYLEYPITHLALTGPAWPWRATTLFAAALLTAALLGMFLGRLVAGRHDICHPRPVSPSPEPVTSSTAAADLTTGG
jgi:putative intracellular protease/amidase